MKLLEVKTTETGWEVNYLNGTEKHSLETPHWEDVARLVGRLAPPPTTGAGPLISTGVIRALAASASMVPLTTSSTGMANNTANANAYNTLSEAGRHMAACASTGPANMCRCQVVANASME